ncbi:MAG TPA: hypothetical protein VGE11_18140 [Pseudonocardia sp.]
MSTQATSGTTATHQQPTTEVSGLAMFAGIMLIISGLWACLAGISGILADKIYVTTPQYVYYFDITAWGWTHLVLGVIVAAVGVGVVMGTTWGRILGITVAAISMIVNFAFIPHYPFWSISIIVVDVLIICGLTIRPTAEA